jgi:inorganic pyrophosphatase/exopolyphosphatase
MKIVVTAGSKSADIDVFACAVAYAELLRLEGHEGIAVVEGSFTSSATPSLVALTSAYETGYSPDGSEEFVLVDISDPEHVAKFVDQKRIREVYDHRPGYEAHWEESLGSDARIELVGACGTLIWEEFKKRGKADQISTSSAELLVGSIVSNTLAFNSPQTTDRDRDAFSELKKMAKLPEDWIASYFTEQEKELLEHFKEYVFADTKVFSSKWGKFAIGQIEMWNASTILDTHKSEIDAVMSEFREIPWIVNIVNISKGFNYVYSKSEKGRAIIEEQIGLDFKGSDMAQTPELLMRKYLMKTLI